jgi:uncharacterized membrane protein
MLLNPMPAVQHGWADAAMIGAIVVFATVGDVMIAAAMRAIGDLDDIKAARGLSGAIFAVLGSARFVAGVFFLVAPASASLTFVTNAVAAKIFLKENVDRRRWIAAVCVCAGVVLMAH